MTFPYPAVAGGTSLLSHARELKSENLGGHFEIGVGARVIRDDGKIFVDWEMGLLGILLGHADPEVGEAVECAVDDGIASLPLGHSLETDVAKTILRLAGQDNGQVRFVLSGSAACSAAVRIARAITGRDTVISIGYHGVDDWALAHTPPAWGVPGWARVFTFAEKYNDLAGVASRFEADEDIACVIVETETTESPAPGYLQGIRDLCTKYGAAMIADECIVAGRYPEFTGWRHYGVEPDMWVTSKVLTNGLPLGAVIGKREWMRGFDFDFRPDYADTGIGPIYISGTHSANGICLAAAAKCLSVWERDEVPLQLENQGRQLRASLLATISDCGLDKHIAVKGPYYRLLLDAPDLRHKTALMHSLVENGHIIGSGWNLCNSHGDAERESMQEAWVIACQDLRRRISEDDWSGIGRTVLSPYRQS